jgi:hypothetical protein
MILYSATLTAEVIQGKMWQRAGKDEEERGAVDSFTFTQVPSENCEKAGCG